ncbi:hypothetical protein Poly24_36010 [Rosistilla carotiformis]|uniref:Agarase n=1 Tax=Rosistilla carotiformis TaxID=2528017 RepID=A0A518JWH5_9BACT|nr:hypothetical protein [Rosistilla carotiformis]QDV69883.1 hypothetical protein Poly24_36010 [Rosistilla carotiformis]
MSVLNRRVFVRQPLLAAAAMSLPAVCGAGAPEVKTTQVAADGFFTVDRRNHRWWIVSPDGRANFSLGLNHIDPAVLQRSEQRLWQKQYGGDVHRWLSESVRKNLIDWGFNCVGFSADEVVIDKDQRRHGRSLSFADHQSLAMPYGYLLPFASNDPHSGQAPPSDYRGADFARWCDRVAQTHCLPMRDDPLLIGYWSAERPDWNRSRFSSATELTEQAAAYYQTIRKAIRRYDPHHLILGDRYDAGRPLSASVVRAALDDVDVLSVDCSGDAVNVHRQLSRMAELFNRPILVADHALDRQPNDGLWPPRENRFHDPGGYGRTVRMLTGIPQVVGYHLCGGYLPSEALRRGLLDAQERPDRHAIEGIRQANQMVPQWVARSSVSASER